VRYAQKHEKRGFFINVTTVLPSSCLLRQSWVFAGRRSSLVRRDAGRNIPEMARPRHNSGLHVVGIDVPSIEAKPMKIARCRRFFLLTMKKVAQGVSLDD